MRHDVEHPDAYERAIYRNIQLNARKTRHRVWYSMPGAERVNDFLFAMGEFDGTYKDDRFQELHPVVRASLGDFYRTLADAVTQWGGLTEKQHAAALAMIERSEARVAERAKVKAEQSAKDADLSGWVGAVGGRVMLTFTLRLVLTMDGIYGLSYLHVGADDAGNVIVYKGTKRLGDKGASVCVKATIKEHGVRDGVKQTVITRPAEV